MNSKVHPLVVFLVILSTLLAIGMWMWGTGESKKFGGPAGLRSGPNGHLYIQIQNQLLEHDASGVFLRRHDLGALNVQVVLGTIAIFSNGDVLLRRGPDPRGFVDNIRAYARKTNDASLTPQTADTGLYRCDLATSACSLFGAEVIDFKAAHNIFIDWTTDDVYISDTTRHVIRKYSADGTPLAGPAGGFRFPNQLTLHNGQLLIADTNHHQVRAVDPSTEAFGEQLDAIAVVPAAAVAAEQRWPSRFARVGVDWWVNNMRTGMNEGGIYIFDEDWQYSRRVPLPSNADPISVQPFGDVVLVSDWNNDRVYRISTAGDLLDDFVSPGLEAVLEESRKSRREYEMYSYAGIGLFVLLLAGLLVRGLAVSNSDP